MLDRANYQKMRMYEIIHTGDCPVMWEVRENGFTIKTFTGRGAKVRAQFYANTGTEREA